MPGAKGGIDVTSLAVYVAHPCANTVERFDAAELPVAGTGSPPSVAADVYWPHGIAAPPSGTGPVDTQALYVTQPRSSAIRRYDLASLAQIGDAIPITHTGTPRRRLPERWRDRGPGPRLRDREPGRRLRGEDLRLRLDQPRARSSSSSTSAAPAPSRVSSTARSRSTRWRLSQASPRQWWSRTATTSGSSGSPPSPPTTARSTGSRRQATPAPRPSQARPAAPTRRSPTTARSAMATRGSRSPAAPGSRRRPRSCSPSTSQRTPARSRSQTTPPSTTHSGSHRGRSGSTGSSRRARPTACAAASSSNSRAPGAAPRPTRSASTAAARRSAPHGSPAAKNGWVLRVVAADEGSGLAEIRTAPREAGPYQERSFESRILLERRKDARWVKVADLVGNVSGLERSSRRR